MDPLLTVIAFIAGVICVVLLGLTMLRPASSAIRPPPRELRGMELGPRELPPEP